MDTQTLQTSLEMWFAAFSLIAVACLLVGREDISSGRKFLIVLELGNAVFMGSEALAWLLDGAAGTMNRYIIYVSNFLSFFAEYAMLAMMAYYIRAKVMESSTEKHRHLWRFLLLAIMIFAEVTLIISQFTGWYYTIDATNTYQRGPYFHYAQGVGLAMFLVLLIMLFWYRKCISRWTFMAIALFVISPLVAMVYQYFHYGFSFIGIATTMSVLFLFISYEMDVSKRIENANRQRLEDLEYKY